MSKMHGPDMDTRIRTDDVTHPGMTLADLYKIVYDRLDNVHIDGEMIEGEVLESQHPLSRFIDIEDVTQQVTVEVRKKLGLCVEFDKPEPAGAGSDPVRLRQAKSA